MRTLKRLLLATVVGGALFAAWLLFVWPPPAWYRTHWPSKTAFMRMRERQLRAARDTTPLRYVPVPLDSLSRWLPRAATAGEDEAFFEHHGIDWHSLRQALGYRRDSFSWSSPRDRADLAQAVRTAGARRDKMRGASTITQQLAKNLYLSPSRNPLRKLKEAVITYRLEWALPKERILELYLSTAEMGRNLWGAQAASERYFGRGADDLSMDQAALLIATLPHPLSSNPAYRPGRTQWRQRLILRKLRGENVVVPREPEDVDRPRPRGDTLPALDTTELPVDTAVVPRDTVVVPSLPRDTIQVLPDTTRKP